MVAFGRRKLLRAAGGAAVGAGGARSVAADEHRAIEWGSFFGPGDRRCTPHEVRDAPRPAWETTFPAPTVPIFADGTLFATTDNGELYRVDHYTGTESYLGELPGDTIGLRHHDGVLYALDLKSVAGAFDAETGETIWKRTFERQPGRPVVHDGSLFYPFHDARLERVDPTDGTTTGTLSARTTTTGTEGYAPQLVVAGGSLVLTTIADGGHVIARSTDGTVVWRRRVRGGRAIAATESTVFVAERPRTDPTVAAFGTASGDRQWTVDVPGDRPPGRPAVCDTHVFVGGDHLTAVDRETGVIDWQRELNVGTLAVAGETLYVTTWEPGGTSTTDAVFAFRGRSGERRWRYDGLEPASIWKIGTITDAGPVVGLGDRLVRFGPESVGVDEFPVLAAAAALGGAGLVAYLWRRSR